MSEATWKKKCLPQPPFFAHSQRNFIISPHLIIASYNTVWSSRVKGHSVYWVNVQMSTYTTDTRTLQWGSPQDITDRYTVVEVVVIVVIALLVVQFWHHAGRNTWMQIYRQSEKWTQTNPPMSFLSDKGNGGHTWHLGDKWHVFQFH